MKIWTETCILNQQQQRERSSHSFLIYSLSVESRFLHHLCSYRFSSIDQSGATPWNGNNSSLKGFDFSKTLSRLGSCFLILEPRMSIMQVVGPWMRPYCCLQACHISLPIHSPHNHRLQFHTFFFSTSLLYFLLPPPLAPASLWADDFASSFLSEAGSNPPALPPPPHVPT